MEEHHINEMDAIFHPNPFASTIASFEQGQRLQNIHGGGNDDIVCDDLDASLIGHFFDNLELVARKIRSSNPPSHNNVVPQRKPSIPDSTSRGTMEVTK